MKSTNVRHHLRKTRKRLVPVRKHSRSVKDRPKKIGTSWVGQKYIHGLRKHQPSRYDRFRLGPKREDGSRLVFGRVQGTEEWEVQSTITPNNYAAFTPIRSEKADDLTATQRFGKQNLRRFRKLSSGRDREVFELDNDKVLKIAKNPAGLIQNDAEEKLDALGQLKHYETGKDYVVMEKVNPAGKAVNKLLNEVEKSKLDFNERRRQYESDPEYTERLKKIDEFFEKQGMSELKQEINDYSFDDVRSWDELFRKSSWGEKENKPVIIDPGFLEATNIGFQKNRIKDLRQKAYSNERGSAEAKNLLNEWDEIKSQRRGSPSFSLGKIRKGQTFESVFDDYDTIRFKRQIEDAKYEANNPNFYTQKDIEEGMKKIFGGEENEKN